MNSSTFINKNIWRQRKVTFDGKIKPLLHPFEAEERKLFHRPERKHRFEFLKNYEPPSMQPKINRKLHVQAR